MLHQKTITIYFYIKTTTILLFKKQLLILLLKKTTVASVVETKQLFDLLFATENNTTEPSLPCFLHEHILQTHYIRMLQLLQKRNLPYCRGRNPLILRFQPKQQQQPPSPTKNPTTPPNHSPNLLHRHDFPRLFVLPLVHDPVCALADFLNLQEIIRYRRHLVNLQHRQYGYR